MTTAAPKLIQFDDEREVACATTEQIIKSQNSKLRQPVKKRTRRENRFRLAISGGQLMQMLLKALLYRKEEIEWEKWDIFFVDERLVPFKSNESNYGQLKRGLLDPLKSINYPQPNVYHIEETEIDDANVVAQTYEKQLINIFASRDSVRLPTFDMILLGCAPDGHIASLFPQCHHNLREEMAWVIPITDAPLEPTKRISMSVPVISNSNQIIFMVTGSNNAELMKMIIEKPSCELPSALISTCAPGRVSWYVENEALKEVMLLD